MKKGKPVEPSYYRNFIANTIKKWPYAENDKKNSYTPRGGCESVLFDSLFDHTYNPLVFTPQCTYWDSGLFVSDF